MEKDFNVNKTDKRFIVTVIFLILGGLGVVSTQEAGRPLRVTDQQPMESYSLLPIITRQLPPANSLITPCSLERVLTQRYIEQYTRPSGIAYLNTLVARANIYMPFIREEVTKRQLPPELIYLPVIESSFVITARSRSGAVGLWQFMMNSITPYDMRVTDYIDERRDFIKSTRGALQKLQDNYRVLGCWNLSLAAYNAGLGRVRRSIQSTGINDYWILSEKSELPQETIHYMPKLIAVSYVLSQPRRFGINVWQEKFEWEAIPLRRQVSIDVVADEAGIPRDLMRRLNSQLLHGITPADRNFSLIVPATHIEQVTAVLEREDLRLIRYRYHTIRQGDTLWSLSRYYGITVSMIETHNPGINSRFLRIGQTIIIPILNEGRTLNMPILEVRD
ncbi:MAG: transglycosylase SLT domain-containing protein [Treponema sp.]|jgi:membrane-bound lytic murein transglycosylase D|nr:transglycosylase SLT domain-containing protein [Treponema sp.]